MYLEIMDAASKIFYFYTILKNYFYNRKPYFEYLSTFSVIVELKFSTGFAKLIKKLDCHTQLD